jgi:hypothetical protein
MDDEISASIANITRSTIFMKDANEVSRISDEDFNKIITALQSNSHCHTRLSDYLEDKTQNKSGLGSLVNFLTNLSRLRIAYQISSDHFESLLKPIIESALNDKDPKSFETQKFLHRLPALLADYDLVSREIKIDDLDSKTAAYLEEFTILCDLRPLFCEEGNKIEYLFPYATLHIQFDIAGQSQSHDLKVTEEQIMEIMEKAIRARKKLLALSAYVERLNLAESSR